jgi:hypothetical protein
MIVFDFLRWVFSNSGACRRGHEAVDPQLMLAYAAAKHPLVRRKCKYCGATYWAFTKGNKYCGSFACFRKAFR